MEKYLAYASTDFSWKRDSFFDEIVVGISDVLYFFINKSSSFYDLFSILVEGHSNDIRLMYGQSPCGLTPSRRIVQPMENHSSL
jgi:hypothetical protein